MDSLEIILYTLIVGLTSIGAAILTLWVSQAPARAQAEREAEENRGFLTLLQRQQWIGKSDTDLDRQAKITLAEIRGVSNPKIPAESLDEFMKDYLKLKKQFAAFKDMKKQD